MTTGPAFRTTSRATTVVLALWCCVLMASVAAPWLRTHHAPDGLGNMERLCSDAHSEQWVPSPFTPVPQSADSTQAQGQHHMVDCPLCLPMLAPPQGWLLAPWQVVPRAQPVWWPLAPLLPLWRALPPARGPPCQTHK